MIHSLLLSCFLALTGDEGCPWPEYRGPARDGHAPAHCAPPLAWSEAENVRWKTAIHGRGWSSPVVGEDRVWLTTADPEGHALSVICVDLASGDVLLDRVLFDVEAPQERHDFNSYASPSPVVEPGRVYLSFGTEGFACLDSVGFEVLWTRTDLNCDHIAGPGSSPLLLQDRLVLNVDGGDVQYVVALDKATGKTLWSTDRTVPLDSLEPDLRKAYSTPVLVGDELVSTGARATVAYNPRTGKELWTVLHPGFSMSSRPLVGHGMVYLNTGFNRPQLWAVRLGGQGDVSDTHVAWKATKALPTMATPVMIDERIYVIDDGGIASCLDAKSGKMLWKERLGGPHSASPVYAGGHVYFFDREGRTVAIAPGKEFQQVAESQVDAGFMASPAVVGNAFVLRTESHLYRIEEPGPQ